jgi:hypothetical protein
MRSEPATFSAPVPFEDRSGTTAVQSGVNAVSSFESGADIGRRAASGLRSQAAADGAGGVVIGTLWLALYVIAVVHALTFEHRPPAPIPSMVRANAIAHP